MHIHAEYLHRLSPPDEGLEHLVAYFMRKHKHRLQSDLWPGWRHGKLHASRARQILRQRRKGSESSLVIGQLVTGVVEDYVEVVTQIVEHPGGDVRLVECHRLSADGVLPMALPDLDVVDRGQISTAAIPLAALGIVNLRLRDARNCDYRCSLRRRVEAAYAAFVGDLRESR